MHIVIPRLHPDAVIWGRVEEVFSKVIDNDDPLQRPPNLGQVFDSIVLGRSGVLPVKAMLDHDSILIEVVEYPVCVVWHGSSKHHNLVVPAHLLQELYRPWPDEVATFFIVVILIEVDKCLIQI